MSTKSNGANFGAVMKVGMRVSNNKPPKRRPFGYESANERLNFGKMQDDKNSHGD